jgi:hypothetical protein
MMSVHRIPGYLFAVVLLLAATVLPAAAAPVLLFDQGHDQRFVIDKDGPLHLSGLAGVMREAGYDVRSSGAPLTAETLAGVDVLVVSGPFAAFLPAEVDTVAEFVSRGGKLAVMIHIPQTLDGLLRRLDIDFTNYVINEQENVIDGDRRNFQVKNLVPHPLFNGLDRFSIYGGWALLNSGDGVRIISSTSDRAWVDLNGDGKLSRGDAVQAFGMVIDGTRGAGRYVVFGDDALFQNKFLEQQNRQLARNLAQWLK